MRKFLPMSAIRLLGEDQKYVSRGGLKLERALEHWHIDVKRRFAWMWALRPVASQTVCCNMARVA